MNISLTIIISFFLLTSNIYSQRNDGFRKGSEERGKTERVERSPNKTTPVVKPRIGGNGRSPDNKTITYPKNPDVSRPETVPCGSSTTVIICIESQRPVSNIKYDPPLPSDLEIANAFYNAGDYYEAAQSFTLHLAHTPDDTTALYFRGICYYEIQWYGFAIADFDFVLELDSLYAGAYYYRGLSRLFREEKSQAITDLQTAYELKYELAGYILKKYF